MKMKKKFVTPRVVQEVRIQLEKDFLVGPSVTTNMRVVGMGQERVEHDFTEQTAESYWE